MKKLFFLAVLLNVGMLAQAQDLTDALRYAQDGLNGTARYMSMGGAFSALGGDISAMQDNPAGSAVFLTNKVALSLDLHAYKNETNYTDGFNSYNNNDFNLNQAGVVFVFNNYDKSDAISRLSFGVAYNRGNSFDNRWTASGNSSETVSERFLNFAQGVPLEYFEMKNGESISDLYAYLGSANLGFNNNRLQTAFLGYQGFLFDAVNSGLNNTDYVSNVSGNSFSHVYHNYTEGMNGKLSFNGGIAINDRFYFGVNLNSHMMNYDQTTILNEYIPSPSAINEINFINNLSVEGSGFSFQVGGIARLNDMFRVSVAYESPTWYTISEETTQFLRTYSQQNGEAIVSPNVINVFSDYKLRTPGKLTGGLAAVFGGAGLISFEYSYKDLSNTEYTSVGFADPNAAISNKLQAVSTFRLGGEYRLKDVSFRAGFRYKNSPYENTAIMSDLKGYSAGIGYDFGNVKLDFAYDLAQRDYQRSLLHSGFSNQASIDNTISQYVLTLAFTL